LRGEGGNQKKKKKKKKKTSSRRTTTSSKRLSYKKQLTQTHKLKQLIINNRA
jgi:hypothetical protein